MSILESPLKIGKLAVKNRLVMPPMATPKSLNDGLVTGELCAYYAEKSQGGYLGLVITEHSYVNIVGKAHSGQLSIADDGTIESLTRLTEAVHRNNTPIFAQISHAGGRTHAAITGHEAVAPSAVELPNSKAGVPVARAMTPEDIHQLTRDFASAAVRAKRAGYDGVELHAAHSYLLNQFLSPISNRRCDAYTGATLEGRIRLPLEIIAAVRGAVGTGYPIAVRLAACDFIEGGIVLEDTVAAAQAFEKAGVDMLDISGGFYGYLRPNETEQGYFGDLSMAVKEALTVPVVLTGGVQDGPGAERLLREGKADLIGVGRALLKNSAWAKEALRAV